MRIDAEADRCDCKNRVFAAVQGLVEEARENPTVYEETEADLLKRLNMAADLGDTRTIVRHIEAKHRAERTIGGRLVVASFETYACGKRHWHASLGAPKENGAFRCYTVRDGVIDAWITQAIEMPPGTRGDLTRDTRVMHFDWTEPLLS